MLNIDWSRSLSDFQSLTLTVMIWVSQCLCLCLSWAVKTPPVVYLFSLQMAFFMSCDERFHQRMISLLSDADFLYSFFLGFVPSLMDITTDFAFADRFCSVCIVSIIPLLIVIIILNQQVGKRGWTGGLRRSLCLDHHALLRSCHLWSWNNLGEQSEISTSCAHGNSCRRAQSQTH